MSDNLSVLLLQDLICNGSKEVLLARQNAPSLPAVFGIFRRREGQMAERRRREEEEEEEGASTASKRATVATTTTTR